MVMYGSAVQDGFASNPSRNLLWIYYVAAIFLTNVTFLNLLIAVMSTTYEQVTNTEERGMLVEQSRIYYDYNDFLNLMYPKVTKMFNRRYMFVANIDRSEFEVPTKLESEFAGLKRDVKKEIDVIKDQMGANMHELRHEMNWKIDRLQK
jgi:hypothetical protein